MAGCIFGSFNFLAIRRIGKNVHCSVKQMYFGMIGLVFSIVYLLITQPEYFTKFEYTKQMLILTILTAFFFYIMQMTLSMSLVNLRVGTVCCFCYTNVIVSYFL